MSVRSFGAGAGRGGPFWMAKIIMTEARLAAAKAAFEAGLPVIEAQRAATYAQPQEMQAANAATKNVRKSWRLARLICQMQGARFAVAVVLARGNALLAKAIEESAAPPTRLP